MIETLLVADVDLFALLFSVFLTNNFGGFVDGKKLTARTSSWGDHACSGVGSAENCESVDARRRYGGPEEVLEGSTQCVV